MTDEKNETSVKDPTLAYCARMTANVPPILEELYKSTSTNEWSFIAGDPEVITILQNFMRLIDAKRVLDIGTFTGVSALAAALTIPEDGKVISMDISPEDFVKHGKEIVDKSGVANKIEFRWKPANETLDELIAKGESGTFDFAFIDAYKDDYPDYYKRCFQLLRPKGIMIFDNALFDGKVQKENEHDSWVDAVRLTHKMAYEDPAVDSALLNVSDGLLIVFKR